MYWKWNCYNRFNEQNGMESKWNGYNRFDAQNRNGGWLVFTPEWNGSGVEIESKCIRSGMVITGSLNKLEWNLNEMGITDARVRCTKPKSRWLVFGYNRFDK